MLTEKDYCDYETCVALKELGFSSVNNECFQSKIVSKEIPLKFFDTILQGTSLEYAPIISLYEAQKWLREEKNAFVVILPYTYNIIDEIHTWTYELWFGDNLEFEIHNFKSYEEAISKGIKKAVKILREENNENNL